MIFGAASRRHTTEQTRGTHHPLYPKGNDRPDLQLRPTTPGHHQVDAIPVIREHASPSTKPTPINDISLNAALSFNYDETTGLHVLDSKPKTVNGLAHTAVEKFKIPPSSAPRRKNSIISNVFMTITILAALCITNVGGARLDEFLDKKSDDIPATLVQWRSSAPPTRTTYMSSSDALAQEMIFNDEPLVDITGKSALLNDHKRHGGHGREMQSYRYYTSWRGLKTHGSWLVLLETNIPSEPQMWTPSGVTCWTYGLSHLCKCETPPCAYVQFLFRGSPELGDSVHHWLWSETGTQTGYVMGRFYSASGLCYNIPAPSAPTFITIIGSADHRFRRLLSHHGTSSGWRDVGEYTSKQGSGPAKIQHHCSPDYNGLHLPGVSPCQKQCGSRRRLTFGLCTFLIAVVAEEGVALVMTAISEITIDIAGAAYPLVVGDTLEADGLDWVIKRGAEELFDGASEDIVTDNEGQRIFQYGIRDINEYDSSNVLLKHNIADGLAGHTTEVAGDALNSEIIATGESAMQGMRTSEGVYTYNAAAAGNDGSTFLRVTQRVENTLIGRPAPAA